MGTSFPAEHWHCLLHFSPQVPQGFVSPQGLLRFEAQEAVLLALLALALYRGCHAHPTMVPHCSRTQDDIEPILRAQC
ncbi:hypothetical protein O3P69_000936 [Scylla paramamosain]|uniref:Uncharacterized protein n=1 Tax=Scylla paramamosain TaxID=85552 RepID=A0AAW0UTR9_SCYPA